MQKTWRAGNSATTQARNQGCELTHTNTHPIYDPWELVTQAQSCRISTTQDSRTAKSSPRTQ